MGKKYTADDFVGAVTGTASGNVAKTGDTMTGTLTNTATDTTTRINNTNAQTGAGMLSFQADSGSISDKFVFSRSGSGGQQAAIKFEEASGTYANNLIKFELSEPNSYSSTDYFELRHSSASSSERFIKAYQPLIAGGGIYLGTTTKTSANYLDDYEEGTFTPAYAGSSGLAITHDTQVGRYVKVGRFVWVGIELGSDAVTYASGSLEITGLPFLADDLDGAAIPGLNYSFQTSLADYTFSISENNNKIFIWQHNSTSRYPTNQLGTGTNANRLRLVATYITTT